MKPNECIKIIITHIMYRNKQQKQNHMIVTNSIDTNSKSGTMLLLQITTIHLKIVCRYMCILQNTTKTQII